MDSGQTEGSTTGSPFDDLVLVVEAVRPSHNGSPEFVVVEVGGRPVARGDVAPADAAGVILEATQVSEATRLHLRRAWQTRLPQRYVADRPEGRYDVYISPIVGGVDRGRFVMHMIERHDRAERRRNVVNAAIVDALPGSVALLDPSGTIRAVNAGWVRFGLERSHDGVLADAGTDYLDVTDRAAANESSAREAADAIRSVLAGNVDLATAEYPSDRSEVAEAFTMRVAPVDVDGERWVVVAHEDVTALRHALDRWHTTFSSAAVATIVVDRDGTVVDANAAFAELVGVDHARCVARSAMDFVHDDDHDDVLGLLERARAGSAELTARELKVQRADGSTAIVMMHPSAISPNQRQGAVIQLVDLTQQRRAEARLALQRELLELVASGTPLAEVATAVALNIGRAIDGASGSVHVAGSAPFTSPDLPSDLPPDRMWRVTIDAARDARGAIEIVSPAGRPAGPDDRSTAAMLASIVRLALQRDETAGALATATLHDPVSGLPTSELFGEQLARTIEWLGLRPTTIAVLAVGPVDFDDLLAREGWRGAEARLADIGATVRAVAPAAAMVARRGQQILALIEIASADEASAIGAQLSASGDIAVGVTTASSVRADADDVLGEADEALAAARLRVDRLAIFGPAMRERSHDDALADDLRRGLAAGEVTVHYQPILDLRSGATVSLEALVRWHHPTRGAVSPPELIHTAEECGLIHEVGALVLTTACRDLAGWRRAGATDLTVAVNLSARQLADPDLVRLVRLAIADVGLEPSALVVEITESVVVEDVDLVAGALAELRALGVRVAIDDFGTGYSSLLYLKRFPADVLKVDRAFVQGLGVHDGDTAIVEAVVGLGHRLGLEVVAEGVETDQQLTELRRRRCDQAQGFLLQRPVPAEEMGRFLDTGSVEFGPEPPAVPEPELDIDELLSLVTHELSTPLTVIGGHAELLAELMRGDDDGPNAVLDALERNIRNLDELMRSLSSVSHALGSPGPTTSVDLPRFVEQTTNDLGPLVAQHEVRVSLTDRELRADVDPVAVRQILTNLISNAVKFTEPGTVIDISMRAADGTNEVIVADHGPGIPAGREDELFGRFARLGARERGLGLGLHLSRVLARRQGGDLSHQRTPGGGATFVLRLPA